MIATLTGVVAEKLGEVVVLDVRGIGYGVLVPIEDYTQMMTGDTAKLYIHEHIREDVHDLYGFGRLNTKRLFEQLLSVKNVGPKVALAVLGVGPADGLRAAIAAGDVKFLQTAKGVGKRAAEQIVVELRDKVGLVAGAAAEDLVTRGSINLNDEAAQALMTLGYSPQDATLALAGVDPKLSTEARIKQALKGSSL